MITETFLIFLSSWILENTEFTKKINNPEVFSISQQEMSKKACFSSINCKVKAYYVKDVGIFYIDKLEPETKVCDQSIILHELIHHYQNNNNKVIDLDEKTLWTLQEKQALFYQNLFLITQKRKNRNEGPENILQCEGGSYLDLQYKYNRDN